VSGDTKGDLTRHPHAERDDRTDRDDRDDRDDHGGVRRRC